MILKQQIRTGFVFSINDACYSKVSPFGCGSDDGSREKVRPRGEEWDREDDPAQDAGERSVEDAFAHERVARRTRGVFIG